MEITPQTKIVDNISVAIMNCERASNVAHRANHGDLSLHLSIIARQLSVIMGRVKSSIIQENEQRALRDLVAGFNPKGVL